MDVPQGNPKVSKRAKMTSKNFYLNHWKLKKMNEKVLLQIRRFLQSKTFGGKNTFWNLQLYILVLFSYEKCEWDLEFSFWTDFNITQRWWDDAFLLKGKIYILPSLCLCNNLNMLAKQHKGAMRQRPYGHKSSQRLH